MTTNSDNIDFFRLTIKDRDDGQYSNYFSGLKEENNVIFWIGVKMNNNSNIL